MSEQSWRRRDVLKTVAGGALFAGLGTRGAATRTQVSGTVYVGSEDNNLYAVDASDGTEQWAFETGDDVDSSPTVVTDSANGDSIGSRARLGTLGHHGHWQYAGQAIEIMSDDGGSIGTTGKVAAGGGLATLLGGYALIRRSRGGGPENSDQSQ